MELFEFMELLNVAIMKDLEERLWEQWLVDYTRMDKENFISFKDYKEKVMKPKVDNKIDVKKILEDAESIKALDQKGGN